jgi:GAF domain-containing protein
VSVARNRNILDQISNTDHAVQRTVDMLPRVKRGVRGIITERATKAKATSGSMMEAMSRELGVPVLLASLRDRYEVMQYFSYGISIESDCCHLAIISDTVCQKGMQIVPDYRNNADLAIFKGRCREDRARFYIGVPIKDGAGEVIGSIAVLQESRLIATLGFSLEKMQAQGKRLSNHFRDTSKLAQDLV